MTTRDQLVFSALTQDGMYNGQGYDGWNRYSADLGLPVEAWCGDFVTWMFWKCGIPLPSMQAGHKTGFSYTGAAWQFCSDRGLTRNSYQGLPGDFVIFNWQDGGLPFDHVELIASYDPEAGVLHTIGGNSGPSNEHGDWFTDSGGVHRHQWPCPNGVGNADMWGACNAGGLVTFSNSAPPVPVNPPTKAPPWPGRVFVLKSPYMHGADVQMWQAQMAHRGWGITIDNQYGPQSAEVCREFQAQKGLTIDGQVGPQTWSASWTMPVTSA